MVKKIMIVLVGATFGITSITNALANEDHQSIKGPLDSPQAVTKACLECHEEAGDDLLHSRHWNWEGEPVEFHGKKQKLGKKTLLNNYCININSNEPRCTSCHIGYGWKDSSFDFAKKENIDCLVCHDSTGNYKKFPTMAGYPVTKEDVKYFGPKKVPFKKVDLLDAAKKVARPSSKNCGTCHFYGGGGHAVKHGDIDKSLIDGSPDIDIHMGKNKMTCTSCHAPDNDHNIKGAGHASMITGSNHISCENCHSKGHKGSTKKILDRHSKSVACETCHIPKIAKKYPTKTWWDWTVAGDKKKKGGKDKNGKPLYHWKKGEFKWNKDFAPEYAWYNGSTDYVLLGEKIKDPSKVQVFNQPNGSYKDPKAKISPFKVMRGKQFYDKKLKTFLVPQLFGKAGYWKTLDWKKSFVNGMKSVNQPFSGEFASVETEMFWPIDHMVVPKNKALKCGSCHGAKQTRMNWKALGYKSDPRKTKESRFSVKKAK